MARLFSLGKKSSKIINLDYVSLIEVEQERGKNNFYRIRFDLTGTANCDTSVYHEDTFNSAADALDYLYEVLNFEH